MDTSQRFAWILIHSPLETYLDGRRGSRVVVWNVCVVVHSLHGAHPVAACSAGTFLDHRMAMHSVGPWDTHGLVPNGPAPRTC